MAARIDSTEVISFRLKVPRGALERLPQSPAGREIGVVLEEEEGELVVGCKDGESFLRFRSIGAEAMLTEVFVAQDPEGDFFLRVLGPLMVRFAGDLVARLVWTVPERNVHGEFAEVKVTRGITDYPGLGHVPLTEEAPQASQGAGGAVRNELRAGAEELENTRAQDELEVQRLLEQAKEAYQEYLRLKNQKK